MKESFMDECFRAWAMSNRFPLKDFRKKFLEEYARKGMVLIQPMILDDQFDGGMRVDNQHGFIFSRQDFLDIALRLLRRWGFDVMLIREIYENRAMTAYLVDLPDEYIRRHCGSYIAGVVRTYHRSKQNVDMTKKKNEYEM